MNATEMLKRIGDSLGSTATVKSVFGEPIQVEGKTIVPIAKVAYGFGAGGGSRAINSHDSSASSAEPAGEGGGGGGGVRVFPAGALEITGEQTRFIPFSDPRPLAVAFGMGLAVGAVLWGRRRRS